MTINVKPPIDRLAPFFVNLDAKLATMPISARPSYIVKQINNWQMMEKELEAWAKSDCKKPYPFKPELNAIDISRCLNHMMALLGKAQADDVFGKVGFRHAV